METSDAARIQSAACRDGDGTTPSKSFAARAQRAAAKNTRGPAPPKEGRPTNNVQVGKQRNKFVYADLTKHLLANGESEVEVSGLGSTIADAVAVVEMLKKQSMVEVTKIETCRGVETARSATTEKISLWVKKTTAFDAAYAEQMKVRKERTAKETTE